MNKLLTILFAALLSTGMAQVSPTTPPLKPLAITGSLRIDFATRNNPTKEGVVDTYTMNVNVANSAIFKGTITQRPFIKTYLGANQLGVLTYSLDTAVVNPANPAQTRDVGRFFGNVPVDERNVYRFDDGFLKISVLPIGQAKGFESRFTGLSLGKPPAVSGVAKLKQDTMRLVSGKGGAVTLKNYDIMRFQNVVLAAGPVQIYPEVTVAGDMVYDYDRAIWYFKNVTFSYAKDGQRAFDTLTGTIRWIEDPARKTNGVGHYDFDVRVNEPSPSEAAVFGATSDEASFFASDSDIPGLTGFMNYKDSMNGDSVSASTVEIDLHSNKLTKQQTMMLGKLFLFVLTVPLNAE